MKLGSEKSLELGANDGKEGLTVGFDDGLLDGADVGRDVGIDDG